MNLRLNSFHFLCACISPNYTARSLERLKKRIRSKQVNWDQVIQAANQHLLIPALYSGLSEKELLPLIDSSLLGYLKECHRLNLNRNLFQKERLIEVMASFDREKIELILFKGGAGFFDKIFPNQGIRIMTDVDIIVPAEELDNVLSILYNLGYQHDKEEFKIYGKMANLFVRGEFANSLELHVDLNKIGCPKIIPVEEFWEQSTLVEVEGVRFRLLSPTHQILYHIIHTEIQHDIYEFGMIELRQLHDFAYRIRHLEGEIIWGAVEERLEAFGFGKIFETYLNLAEKLLFIQLPGNYQSSLSVSLRYLKLMSYVAWPKPSAFYRLILGFFHNLSPEMIVKEFGCKDNLLSVNCHRLLRIKNLIVQFSNLKKIKNLWEYHTRF